MPHLTWEPIDLYNFSNLSGYQFVYQGIMIADSSIYLSLYPMFNRYCSELFATCFIIFVSHRLMGARGSIVGCGTMLQAGRLRF
jgi:hypothetical protein